MRSRKKCNICGKTFKDNHALSVHTRVHTGERPYKCSVCHKAFQQNGNLKQHMALHSTNSQFQCKFCLKYFATKAYLRKHEVVHSEERSIKCTKCDQRFSSRQNVTKHFNLKHNAEYKKPFECTECNGRFDSKIALTYHQAKHTGERKYKCSHCDKTFAWDSSLRGHIKRMHEARERKTCTICGASVFSLREHMKTHRKDRLFNCDLRGNTFKCSQGLTAHLKAHVNEKPEVCAVCDKRFQKRSQLRRHLLLEHYRPVSECLFCYKVVKEYRMEHHLWIHTNEKPNICKYCGEEFFTYDQRYRHVKSCA